VSGSSPTHGDRMPSAPAAPIAPLERPGGPLPTVGVVLVALWCAFLAGAVLLWLRLLLFPGEGADPHGYVRLVGAPFVLVALGLLWWGWRSVGALRRGRRDGWTFLLVLGGVAVAQTVMTAPAVVGAMAGPGTPGTDEGSGPPRGMVVGLLVAITLGLASLVVGVLGRRGAGVEDGSSVDRDGADDRA
jgi:hypothetical protein